MQQGASKWPHFKVACPIVLDLILGPSSTEHHFLLVQKLCLERLYFVFKTEHSSLFQKIFRNCKETLLNDPSAKSGIYYISITNGSQPIQVFCEMSLAHGGWTLVNFSSFKYQNITMENFVQGEKSRKKLF